MLGSGEFVTIAELATREGIAPSYMTRVLRLTLLAPYIVESVLIGTQGSDITLKRMLEPFPLDWREQPTALTPNGLPACPFQSSTALSPASTSPPDGKAGTQGHGSEPPLIRWS